MPISFATEVDAGAITAANWLNDDCIGWSLQHVEELLPTAAVPAGDATPRALRSGNAPAEGAGEAVIERFCAETATDAVIAVRHDEVLLERYLGAMTPDTRHLLMSVSKSVCGLVAGILVDRGALELGRETARYVPELARGPYGSATIRELLDMTAALEFDMTHACADSTVNAEDRAAGWRPPRDGDPRDSRGFLRTLRTVGRPHGARFQYCSATTEVLAWVLERASGLPYPGLVSEVLWSQIGARTDAYFTVDRSGTAYACAGMGATLRDLACLGCLVLERGAYDGRQVVPERWISDILTGGEPDLIAPHVFGIVYPRGSYRSHWWVTGDRNGSIYAAGLCSQYVWVDPRTETVVAKLSSQPVHVESRAQHAGGLRELAKLGAQR